MTQYKIVQFVEAPNQQAANEVGRQMRSHTSPVVVPVGLGPQYVEQYTPVYDPEYSGFDRVVKHIIVTAVLYYVGKSLKDWAKK